MIKSVGILAASMAALLGGGAIYGQTPRPADAPTAQPSTAPTFAKASVPETDDVLDLLQSRYISLFEKVSPAVVRVNAAIPGPTTDSLPTAYVWTGFFIANNGDILTTNAHLLQNATQVWVQSGGVGYPAEVKGLDSVTDVALLHATTLPKNFRVLDLAESPESPVVGTMLLSVTCKEGQSPGPSAGQLQGYNVDVGDRKLPTLYLRTNIPDDGGEIGSPVVDLHGRLVGMMIASLKESSTSFVLPTRAALRVRDDLQTHGKVAYGRLGFVGEQKSDTATGVNVFVSSVDYGGPALAAGLKTGDEVRMLNGQPITSDEDLRQAAFYLRPGQDVVLGIYRGDQEVQLTLRVGEMPVAATEQPDAKTSPPKAVAPVKPNPASGSLIPGINDPALTPPPVEKTM